MNLLYRPLVCVLTGLALQLTACKTTPETSRTAQPATTPKRKPPVTTLADQNGDQAFLAFLGRLRLAIRARDADTIAGMMTTDFGYQNEPPLQGPGVFEYWNERNLWPELELILQDRFVPKGSQYMVAPSEYVTNYDNYAGYRAGIRLLNGSWKFAFFVND